LPCALEVSGLLKAVDVAHSYDDELLFREVSLLLGPGDRVGLVGPNGVGKSTLLRVLVGELAPDSGQVEFGPGDRIGYFAQQVPDPGTTVGEFLAGAPGELAALARRLDALTARLDSAGDPEPSTWRITPPCRSASPSSAAGRTRPGWTRYGVGWAWT
jgi:ATPase subunit of ABC transporter with duplicated ATPase domains